MPSTLKTSISSGLPDIFRPFAFLLLMNARSRDPNRLLKSSEASDMLQVSNTTLRRWADQGKINSWRISPRGDMRFRQEDLERMKHAQIKHG
ncbi:helix-turn-helix domain-containing protein [Dehalogenimonas formicexedens]|uniref:helix-turn-helix domain-containing protein n=1 Tax=Dehalogenimonas formicexedens TaxID=1839801 RepID=UPI0013149BDA|nr:helix-turn-helix domain-containing protein [Dehalogenimonas formicexedens]